jgi:Flp pilus assembly protein TadB
MTTASPSKTAPTRRRTKISTARKRTPKREIADDSSDEVQKAPINRTVHHIASGQPEQLMILVAAIVFGIAGLIFHLLVVVSIVLMALLLGLIASEARRQRGRGIVSEVVNEAKVVIEEIKRPGQADTGDSSERPATTSESSD